MVGVITAAKLKSVLCEYEKWLCGYACVSVCVHCLSRLSHEQRVHCIIIQNWQPSQAVQGTSIVVSILHWSLLLLCSPPRHSSSSASQGRKEPAIDSALCSASLNCYNHSGILASSPLFESITQSTSMWNLPWGRFDCCRGAIITSLLTTNKYLSERVHIWMGVAKSR